MVSPSYNTNPHHLPLIAVFFKSEWMNSIASLWAGMVAVSLAFGATVNEFVSACVFVFAKHPFDVGDIIEAKSKRLVVQEIYLTHTNFEETPEDGQKGKYLTLSHKVMADELIINWTRTEERLNSSSEFRPNPHSA